MYEPPKNWRWLAYRVGDARKVLGVTRPEFDAIVAAGELEVVKAGRRKVVLADKIFDFMDRRDGRDRHAEYEESERFYERLVSRPAS
jgi:hypothetical protein